LLRILVQHIDYIMDKKIENSLQQLDAFLNDAPKAVLEDAIAEIDILEYDGVRVDEYLLQFLSLSNAQII
jgi:hypothetical protein